MFGWLFGSKRSASSASKETCNGGTKVGALTRLDDSLSRLDESLADLRDTITRFSENAATPPVSVHIFTDGTDRDNIVIYLKRYPKVEYPEFFATVKDFALSLPNEALKVVEMERNGVVWSNMIHILKYELTSDQKRQLRDLVGAVMSEEDDAKERERIKSNQMLDALRAEHK